MNLAAGREDRPRMIWTAKKWGFVMRSSAYKALLCLVLGILIGRFWTLKSPAVQLDYVNEKSAELLSAQIYSTERALNEYLERYFQRGIVAADQYTQAMMELEKSSKLLRVFFDDLALDLREELDDNSAVASRAKFLWEALDILSYRLPPPAEDCGDETLKEQMEILFSVYEYLFGEYPGSAFQTIDTHRTVGEIIDQCCAPEWQTIGAALHEHWPQEK